ncbi:MAG: hypothetical protein INQ03_02955 [Candidatus Heimdallarchaeota archaeon]|nr:hypothetical protein [Candidatus Heimdallarchaeota archaeon]
MAIENKKDAKDFFLNLYDISSMSLQGTSVSQEIIFEIAFLGTIVEIAKTHPIDPGFPLQGLDFGSEGMLGNPTSIAEMARRIMDQFSLVFRRNAFRNWYTGGNNAVLYSRDNKNIIAYILGLNEEAWSEFIEQVGIDADVSLVIKKLSKLYHA